MAVHVGIDLGTTAAAFWRAARADAGGSVALGGNAAFVRRLGVAIRLARSSFVLDDSALVYRANPVALRATAGL
jgi:hypothetical protein